MTLQAPAGSKTVMGKLRAVTCAQLRKNLFVSLAALVAAVLLTVGVGLQILLSRKDDPGLPGTILYSNASFPTMPPPLPPITVLTSAYVGQYSTERQIELSLIAMRNQRLSTVARTHRIYEHGMSFTPSSGVTGRVLSADENVTYRTLFAEAQDFGGVVVLANADIYFDESLLCASMISNRTVLALSRHPSPDCFTKSARGDRGSEPVDFCDGYHPTHQASHDVFVFTPPMPITFLHALGDLKVNQFGAENVVIALLKAEGFHVVNPCANIHAFHQHCTRERAPSAKAGAKSIATERGQFAGTFRSGLVHGRKWMHSEYAAQYGAVDCLGLGLTYGQRLRKR